jgi:hypothetical protein
MYIGSIFFCVIYLFFYIYFFSLPSLLLKYSFPSLAHLISHIPRVQIATTKKRIRKQRIRNKKKEKRKKKKEKRKKKKEKRKKKKEKRKKKRKKQK